MKKYKALWFDDKFKELEIIKESALLENIFLVGFDNAEDGIKELEKNILFYDAVIIDGIFYEKNGQNEDDLLSIKDEALKKVFLALERLSTTKKIPSFILSGQKSLTKEINRVADVFKNNKVYDKLNEEHKTQLWLDIKTEADLQIDTQIKHEFDSVFEICNEKYIGLHSAKPLLQILKSVRKPLDYFEDELYFTQIRIIIESVFRSANKYGFLHDACIVNGKVNLTESNLFLAGENTKYANVKCSKKHFNQIISESVKNILFITGAASHTIDPEIKNNINLNEYRTIIKSPFLLYSLTFQVMDLLIWFKNYVDENSNTEENKTLWEFVLKKGDFFEGKIDNDADGNYYCGEYILNKNYILARFKIGDTIKIIEFSENGDYKTKGLYKYYASKTIKI